MKYIGVPYVRAKNKEVADGLDLVIQTDWLQLVGVVRMFSRTEKGEECRRRYLDSKTDPCFYAKAPGHRIYISLHSTLLSDVTQKEVELSKKEIHKSLQEMGKFYIGTLPEGLLRNYADDNQ